MPAQTPRRIAIVALTALIAAAAPALAATAKRSFATKETLRLDRGRLTVVVSSRPSDRLRVRLELRVTAQSRSAAVATVTPCRRASGGALRCSSASRKRTDRFLLRTGRTLLTRTVEVGIRGFRVPCARVDLRESRPGPDVALLGTSSRRYVNVCLP